MLICPRCQSEQVIKNGHMHIGTPKFACQACGRQCVEAPTKRVMSDETRALVDKLLLERGSLAGIVHITNVAPACLQMQVNRKAAQPHQADVPAQQTAIDPSV